MDLEFRQHVNAVKTLAAAEDEARKKRRNQKMLELLSICKKHGGPVTPDCISLLDRLSEKQLLTEVGYIRYTVCKDIREKRRVPAGDGKYRMFRFKDGIKAVLKVEVAIEDDIDALIKQALMMANEE